MANPRSSRSGASSAHPTRQQLDELEALLQRMLQLPVSPAGDEPAAPPAPDPVVARSPDRATAASTGIPEASGDLRSGPVGRSGDRPTTRSEDRPTARSEDRPTTKGAAPREDRPTKADHADSAANADEAQSAGLPVQPPHRFRDRPQSPQEEVHAGETEGEEDWVPLRSSWKPSAHTWGPLAESWEQAQRGSGRQRIRHDDKPAAEQPATPPPTPALTPRLVSRHEAEENKPGPIAEEPAPQPVERLVYPRPAFPPLPQSILTTPGNTQPRNLVPGPAGTQTELPLAVLPLVWINHGFDALVGRAGKPGRWLCGPAGRNFLGSLGILSLVGALALVIAGWLGWTR